MKHLVKHLKELGYPEGSGTILMSFRLRRDKLGCYEALSGFV